MSRLLDVLSSGVRSAYAPSINNLDDYAKALDAFGYAGLGYPVGNPSNSVQVQTTMPGVKAEPIYDDFQGLVQAAYKANGVIFAIELARMLGFSSVRFAFQRYNQGKPSELFGTPDLQLLEKPWPGGTTQELLKRVILDADLGGNAYWTQPPGEKQLVRLRPDWCYILAGKRHVPSLTLDPNGRPLPGLLWWDKVGVVYIDGGWDSGEEPVLVETPDLMHFAPTPDPTARFRGMSWLSPVIRQIQGDQMMERHKLRFFENAATPNLVVKHDAHATEEGVKRFAKMMDEQYGGSWNAYKTMHLYPGADATVVGANMEQVQFHAVQGHGETRLAAAGRVPPIVVGLSEGLEAATYSNYGQARRAFADMLLHPLWGDAAGSFGTLMDPAIQRMPQSQGVRLWYDPRDVPLLREDGKQAAEIQQIQAATIRNLVDGGYTPDSAKRAVLSGDFSLLEHTGMFSVQLQPPGAQQNPPQGGQAS